MARGTRVSSRRTKTGAQQPQRKQQTILEERGAIVQDEVDTRKLSTSLDSDTGPHAEPGAALVVAEAVQEGRLAERALVVQVGRDLGVLLGDQGRVDVGGEDASE